MTLEDPNRRFAAFLRDNVDLGRRRDTDAGDRLFSTGEPADSMYFVESGTVELDFDHSSKTIAAEGFFGELALLFGSHLRTATAIAGTPGRVIEFDRAAFERLVDRDPRLLVEMLRHICLTLLDSERSLVSDLTHQNRALRETIRRLQTTEKELDDAETAAQTDVLTGLYNRRGLEEQIEDLLARAAEAGDQPTLLLLDLDHFKQINDTHGHGCGDRALAEMARRIRDRVRPSDRAYRIGGDEFAVVLLGVEPELAVERARQLFQAINGFTLEVDGTRLTVGISVGGANHRPGENWTELFERADRNLYLIKEGGRGGLAWEGREIRTEPFGDAAGG